MALTVINETRKGGRIGEALGSGISGLLNNLVQKKAQEMQQKTSAQGYEKAWGLTPEQAQDISRLSPEDQQEIRKALVANQQAKAFNKEINGGNGHEGSQPSGTMLQPQPQPSLQEAMSGMGAGNQEGPENAILMNLQKLLPQLQRQAQEGQGQPTMQPGGAQPQAPMHGQPQGAQGNGGGSIADILGNQPLSNPQLLGKAAEIKERRQKDINADTRDSYNEIKEQYRDAKAMRSDLKELERLIGREDLNDPRLVSVVEGIRKAFNLDLTGMLTTDTQEYQKVAQNFLKFAQQALGGRVTNTGMENFLKTIPNLMLSNEGKRAVIKQFYRVLDVRDARYNASREIMRENGGKRPFDFDEQVEERTDKQLAKVADEINNFTAPDNEYGDLPNPASYKGKDIFDADKNAVGSVKNGKWQWRKATPTEIKTHGG